MFKQTSISPSTSTSNSTSTSTKSKVTSKIPIITKTKQMTMSNFILDSAFVDTIKKKERAAASAAKKKMKEQTKLFNSFRKYGVDNHNPLAKR